MRVGAGVARVDRGLEGVRPRPALGARELLLGSSLLIVAAIVTRPAIDPDYWWHVQTGRWIADQRRLPGHDLYTFGAVGHPWIDHEYLTEVGMWLLSSRLGAVAASVALGLVAAAGFWLLLRTAQLRRPAYAVLGLGLLVAALAGLPVWGTRPQMVTFALACLELYWLHRYLEGAGAAIRWFPLVMVPWANLHGGWIIAFVFLALAVLSEAGRALATPAGRAAHLGRAGRLGLVALLSALAVACTPNGLPLYLYPLRTQASLAQQRYIAEWQTPNLHDPAFWPFAAMVLLVVVGLSLRRPRLFELLLVVTTLAMALFSLRHIPLFVAAATPVLVWSWSDAWRQVQDRLPLPRDTRRPPAALLTATTALALGLVGAAVAVGVARAEAGEPQDLRHLYPVAATDRVLAGDPRCARVFDEYGWGGYLVGRFSPDPGRRVFVFGEADVMGDPLIERYMRIWRAQPGWLGDLQGTGADCVLVDAHSPLAGALAARPGWRLAYADAVAVLYVRSGAGPGPLPPRP